MVMALPFEDAPPVTSRSPPPVSERAAAGQNSSSPSRHGFRSMLPVSTSRWIWTGMEPHSHATPGPGLADLLCLPTPTASRAAAPASCISSHHKRASVFRVSEFSQRHCEDHLAQKPIFVTVLL